MSVNRVILVGRLGKDPETRYTSGGQPVCHFTMATDESYKDKSGEKQKRTDNGNDGSDRILAAKHRKPPG